jgi:hypothetical protein
MFPRDPIFELDLAYATMRERERRAANERLIRHARADRRPSPSAVGRFLAFLGGLLIDVGLRLQERYSPSVRGPYVV